MNVGFEYGFFGSCLTGLAMTSLGLELIPNSWPCLQTNSEVVGPQTNTQLLLIPINMRCSQPQTFYGSAHNL